jgi:excisionase family DNA binding protein
VTVNEAAEVLGIRPATVYQLCRERKLAHYKVGPGGGRIVILPADVAAYLAAHRVEAEPEEAPVKGSPPPARGLPAALALRRIAERRRARINDCKNVQASR